MSSIYHFQETKTNLITDFTSVYETHSGSRKFVMENTECTSRKFENLFQRAS
jgi:hypothetical protein